MSEEEMRRKMEFIVNQQAQFTVDIQRLRETQEAEAKLWREKYNGLTDALTTVVGLVGRLATTQEQLAQEQKRSAAQLAELAGQIKILTAKQAETDERLNIFINVVERYISERRNGRARDEGMTSLRPRRE